MRRGTERTAERHAERVPSRRGTETSAEPKGDAGHAGGYPQAVTDFVVPLSAGKGVSSLHTGLLQAAQRTVGNQAVQRLLVQAAPHLAQRAIGRQAAVQRNGGKEKRKAGVLDSGGGGDTANAGRPKRSKPPTPPRWIEPPKWGPWSGRTGGTSVHVILGPTACESTNYGSVPDENTPSIMRLLKRWHPEYNWKAGHLLNDGMGGHGVAENLTPVTGIANRNMATYENRVKGAMNTAKRLAGDPKTTYWYGIEYKVTVSDEKWNRPVPLNQVAKSIHIEATPKKQDKYGNSVEDLNTADEFDSSFLNAFIDIDQTIDNTR